MAATLVRLSSSLTILTDYSADGEHLGKMWVMTSMRANPPAIIHAMCATVRARTVSDDRTAIEQGNGRHLLEPVLEAMTACGSLE